MQSSNSPAFLSSSVGVQSHPGMTRHENQDRISRAATPYGDLYLLADGVGGYKGGAEAAQYVVDAFVQYLNSATEKNAIQALKAAADSISADLRHKAAQSETLTGMSSTVVLALINGTHVIIGHAGDSRAYLLRGEQFRQLTRDHSVMERLISENHLSDFEARSHPDASILTQALGQRPEVELETLEFDLEPGDALLLCSDGLWGYASQEDIQKVVSSQNLSPNTVAEALLSLALDGGGGDNVSIQFIRFRAPIPAAVKMRPRLLGMPLSKAISVLTAAVLLGLVAGGMAISNYRGRIGTPIILQAVSSASKPATSTVTAPLPGRVDVTVITFDGAIQPAWQKTLLTGSRPDLNVTTQPGNGLCRALARPSATLFYTSTGEETAKKIQRDLKIGSENLQAASQEKLLACGGSPIIVLPEMPSPSLLDQMKKDAQKLEKQIPHP
jgi:protein phosphatase